jgi:hypothetical protein
MNARILATAVIAMTTCALLPASAADPLMLALVMPDAKILAGVNVDQAKATPFGQYVLAQIAPQDAQLQGLFTLTGFDPRRDVRELLAASNGTANNAVSLVRGAFDPAKIAATAAAGGAKTEEYASFTILEDAKQSVGMAFLDSSLAAIGPVAMVKAVIDRRRTPTVLPADVLSAVNQWSLSQDAWVVSALSLSSMKTAGAAQIPGLDQLAAMTLIQKAAAGVKFGPTILVTAQAQADTAQNATSLAGVVLFMKNLAQTQAAQDPQTTDLLKSISVTAQGAVVNFSLSVTEAQLEGLLKPAASGSETGKSAPSAAPRQAPAKKVI